MHWMRDWSMPYPFVVESAHGAVLHDVDGNDYADFCLGDTGAMFGHSPAPVAEAIARQAEPRPHLHAAHRGRDRGRAAACASASACRNGRSPRRRPTPTASRCAWRAPSPAGRGSWCSTAATTARWTRPSCGWSTAGRCTGPACSARPRDLTAARARRRVQRPARARGSARTWRRGLRDRRAGHDQFLHGAARARLPRRAAAPHARGRHAAADRRDAHDLDGSRRLHARARPRAGPLRARQAHRRRRAGERLGLHRRGRATPRRGARDDTAGPFRHGHDALGQRAVARGHARHARARDDATRPTRTWTRSPDGWPRGSWASCRPTACPGTSCVSAPASSSSARLGRCATAREAEAAHAPALEQAIHLALLNRGCLIAPFHNMMLVSPATSAGTGGYAVQGVRGRGREPDAARPAVKIQPGDRR